VSSSLRVKDENENKSMNSTNTTNNSNFPTL